ncbi:YggS family pyridoxal phosphate-dependent enzyme [Trichlorobacter lovleyi]|uniref:Pyridoxal phosphate homeostasis protein n=1 Tax=Trichlorobacter lovleyi (strain ATCC BAA-1151 / DSM 17278 / SZ) TaxID=398767 RepID=B3E2D5_TRIL1|nr:YggS family pyridoxal phosphate-dependent enzyme [Trichlorobacter lovleyi]ACD94188.1 alanine racemase domain protein [Trichlorobacter lovleyi SZ]
MSVTGNLAAVQARIQRACTISGRAPSTVRLVAVSKLHPAALVAEAAAAGQTVFGENYVQELVDKAAQLARPVEWHMIGHLQSNKVKYLPGIVSMIHTVDRLSLAQEIDRQWRDKQSAACDILVQVNVSGEATKSGTTATEAVELVRHIAKLPNVRVRGLMTMPPFFDDPEAARPYFRELRLLADRISSEQIPAVEMTELSMGMSGDFEVAIEEGATLVRVGTAIFGGR